MNPLPVVRMTSLKYNHGVSRGLKRDRAEEIIVDIFVIYGVDSIFSFKGVEVLSCFFSIALSFLNLTFIMFSQR